MSILAAFLQGVPAHHRIASIIAMAIDGVPIDMQDEVLKRAALQDYAEIVSSPAIAAGVLTLDMEDGNVFDVTLTEDVDTLVVDHPAAIGRAGSIGLFIRQDATGGRALTWPANVKWPAQVPPVVTSAAGALDVYGLITLDAGTTWVGMGQQDFG